jgi:hypothetical protein
MSARGFVLIVLMVVGAGIEPAWADLNTTSTSRSVVAAVTTGITDSDSTAATGTYTHGALSISTGAFPGSLMALVSQSSTVPPPTPTSMTGSGGTVVDVASPVGAGFSVLADSFFDVFFTVDVDQSYQLNANVTWTGPPIGGVGGFSMVELKDVTHSTTLATLKKHVGDQGSADLGVSGVLVALSTATSYRLTAQSRIDGGSGGMPVTLHTTGDWGFQLDATSIPEPGAWVFSIPVILGLGVVGLWRRMRAARQLAGLH